MYQEMNEAKSEPPLHAACRSDDIEQCKMLIARGADVNARSPHDKAVPLACCQSLETLQLLLDAGADLYRTGGLFFWRGEDNYLNDNPCICELYLLKHARQMGLDLQRVLLPMDHDPEFRRNTTSATAALATAIKLNCLDTCYVLVQQGMDLNPSYSTYSDFELSPKAPLLLAAEWGRGEICRMLMQNGARPNYGGSPGHNQWELALCNAATSGQYDTCRVLLEGGADPNLFDHMGGTPLYYAADRGDVSIIVLLLSSSANINGLCVRRYGNHHTATAPFQSLFQSNVEAAKCLLMRGARIWDWDDDFGVDDELDEDLIEYTISRYAEEMCQTSRHAVTLFCGDVVRDTYYIHREGAFYTFVLCTRHMPIPHVSVAILRKIRSYVCTDWGSAAHRACSEFGIFYGLPERPVKRRRSD